MDGASITGTSLAGYLAVVRRRWPVVVVALILVPATAVAVSLNQPKLFRAAAQVLITNQSSQQLLGGSGASTQPIDPTRLANTEIAVAEVPEVAKRTLASLGIRDRSAQALLQSTSVSAASDADVLTVAVTDPNPALASRLVNRYAAEFIRYQRQIDTAAVRAALDGVNSRVATLRTAIASGTKTDPAQVDELRTLLSRQQNLQTQERLQGGKLIVIRRSGSAAQVQPNPVRDGLAGLGIGAIVGVTLAFLVHALDTRVRNAEDVGNILALPLLGRLPTPPRRLRRSGRLAMVEPSASPQADAYHRLRTAVELASLTARSKIVLITSAVRSEGKSTTTANLAVALARSAGRRVVVVDLDLREPRIGQLFGVDDDQPGVTGVATGNVSLQDALVSVPVRPAGEPVDKSSGKLDANGYLGSDGALDVLPSGPTPPDPAGFLTTDAVRAILYRLGEAYDIVLIDTPPALVLGDAISISTGVDAMVIVARAGVARRHSLFELRRLLDTAPCSKLGFVLTGVQPSAAESYGAYGPYGGSVATQSRRKTSSTTS